MIGAAPSPRFSAQPRVIGGWHPPHRRALLAYLPDAKRPHAGRRELPRKKQALAEGRWRLRDVSRHSTAVGLTDLPAGLAAWTVEKFQEWSDCRDDIESSYSKDELLTNVMLYRATGTIG